MFPVENAASLALGKHTESLSNTFYVSLNFWFILYNIFMPPLHISTGRKGTTCWGMNKHVCICKLIAPRSYKHQFRVWLLVFWWDYEKFLEGWHVSLNRLGSRCLKEQGRMGSTIVDHRQVGDSLEELSLLETGLQWIVKTDVLWGRGGSRKGTSPGFLLSSA